MIDVIILAGGVGSRLKSAVPKQFIEIDGCPIIVHTIRNFQDNPNIDHIIVVCLGNLIEHTKNIVKNIIWIKLQMLFREAQPVIFPRKTEFIF